MMPPWRRFLISEHVVTETEAFLRSFWGKNPREGIVYWAGRRAGHDVLAVTAIAPEATAAALAIETSEASNTRFLKVIRSLDLVHVAQVHSHPLGVEGHSRGDDLWAFMKYPGLVSIVAQDYGRRPLLPLMAVHVYTKDGFVRLNESEVSAKIRILPAARDLRARR